MEIKSVSSTVAERLVTLGSQKVVDSVVDILVGREIEKRSNQLLAAIKEFEELNKSLRKIRPDIVSYNEDGSEASANWSKPKIEEKKKLEEKIKKLEQAVNKATEQNDWSSMNNIGNKDENSGSSKE